MPRRKNEGWERPSGVAHDRNIFGAQTANGLTKATVTLDLFFVGSLYFLRADRETEQRLESVYRERVSKKGRFTPESDSFSGGSARSQLQPEAASAPRVLSPHGRLALLRSSTHRTGTIPFPQRRATNPRPLRPSVARFYRRSRVDAH